MRTSVISEPSSIPISPLNDMESLKYFAPWVRLFFALMTRILLYCSYGSGGGGGGSGGGRGGAGRRF